MKKIVLLVLIVLVVGGGIYLWQNYKGALPAITDSPEDITDVIPSTEDLQDAINNTDIPLKLAKGFTISIFAKNLPAARDLAFDSFGNLWVSQTSEGTITLLELENGRVARQNAVFRNLDRPHGLLIDGNDLYFAEEAKITKALLYSDAPIQKIADLPEGGRHYTRSLVLGKDGRIYVSIGSTCDVCVEKDERISTVYSMNKDGSDFKKVASGLRNSVFMAVHPTTGQIWATEMGRDNLGDDLPPDEINIIESGKNYGWPICYGKNIHDSDFDKNLYETDPCPSKQASHIDLPAHSAPLGLAFIPNNSLWPKEYWGDLLVAFHGSWNRSMPTGYKITRIKLSDSGNYEGSEDFASGWLASDGRTSLGRPVGLKFGSDGALYATDDKAGVVYKIAPQVQEVVVDSPKRGEKVTSPLKISGKAKGTWFFEASFPITLLDEDGSVLVQSHATAQGDWMTEDFVNFTAELTFPTPKGKTGTLFIENDNPSGLPEFHKEFKVPVSF